MEYNSEFIDGFTTEDTFDNYAEWWPEFLSNNTQIIAPVTKTVHETREFSPIYPFLPFFNGQIVSTADDDENGRQKNDHETKNDMVPRLPRSPATRSLAEKMLKMLSLFKESSGPGILAQVWVPVKEHNNYVLSTFSQPYLLDHDLAGFREVSRGFTFSADVKPGGFHGLPGRVFISKVPEWTSNVGYYDKREYLRMDYAVSHGVRGSMAVPVFEDDYCCAVFELVTMMEKSDFRAEMGSVCRALEAVNLKSSAPPLLHKQPLSQNQTAALTEITDVLRAVCHAHNLPLALTWIPSTYPEKLSDKTTKPRIPGCKNSSLSQNSILYIQTDACYANSRELQGFVHACSERYLENEQGTAGKARISNHPFFIPDVKEYDISEYPFVQHARKYGLNGAVAIRVRSSFTGDDDYVLEFFLPVNVNGSSEQQLVLDNLSSFMQRICGSLRTVSEPELSGSLTRGDHVSTVGGSKRQSGKKLSNAEKNVSLSVLQQYFSSSLKDAAKAIGVCPTTLKRICRKHGISRWPSRKIIKVNRSLNKIQTVLESVHGVEGRLRFNPETGDLITANTTEKSSSFLSNNSLDKPSNNIPISQSQSQMKTEKSNCHFLSAINDHDRDRNLSTSAGVTESLNGSISSLSGLKDSKPETLYGNEGCKLTVKATYKEDTVRFKFETSSGWFKLYEEVAKRLKMQTGTFQLRYKDDEEEWVLLVCESDWSEFLEILDRFGTRSVKFRVRDATFSMGSSGSSNCFLSPWLVA